MFSSIITGTGAYVPERIQTNEDFADSVFFGETGTPLSKTTSVIIDTFQKITGIAERRYVDNELVTSDIAAIAGREALANSGLNPELLDQIVVTHNFGNVAHGTAQTQIVPALANRVKQLLGISNPSCIAYDVILGCPGWVHLLIQSHAWFKAGMAQRVLLIGAETLSRVIDKADRDSMIFSDGAGACVLEYKNEDELKGVLGTAFQSHSLEETGYIDMGRSYSDQGSNTVYLKMNGRKVYEYALKHVPLAMKACLENSNVHISQVKKILLHQANEKMDEAIVHRFYQLYDLHPPEGVMPMIIRLLGNSSVATVPTLYHLITKNKIPGHEFHAGDIILFASVGAGMNINAVCYKI